MKNVTIQFTPRNEENNNVVMNKDELINKLVSA